MQHDDDDADMVKVFYHSLLLHMWCVCVWCMCGELMCELLCELMALSYRVDEVELYQGWSSF